MRHYIFKPDKKKDAKIYLYSLKCWALSKTVLAMPSTTLLGEAINRIKKMAIECIYSSSFFKYCIGISKETSIYKYVCEELPKKKWLFALSEKQRKKGMKVSKLFNGSNFYF